MSGWQSYKLGECITLLSGGTPSKACAEYWDGSIPWVSAKDMKTFWIDDSEDRLTALGAKNATRLVPPGTTLMLVRGMTLHNDVPVCRVKKVSAFNQDVKAVSAKDPLLPALLPHLLVAIKPKLLAAVDSAGHGTGRLQTDSLFNIDIVLPGPESQERFAELADAIESKIELNRQINQNLEKIAQTLFKSWFVDFEPVKAKIEAKAAGRDPERAAMCAISGKLEPELNHLPPEQRQQLAATASLFPDELVESELGLIPEGWEVSNIGNEVEVVGGGTPSTNNSEYWENGTYHWTTPRDLSGVADKILAITERRIAKAGLAKISSGLLPIDTVLMSSRAPVGYLALAKVPVAINQGYIAMKCSDRLPPTYVLQWANSVMDEIKQRASGTTFAEISKKNFRLIQVVVPTVTILKTYEKTAVEFYSTISAAISETKTLTEIRDTLLPKLLSGEIEMNGWLNE